MEHRNYRFRGVVPAVRGFANELRRTETPAARLVWAALRRGRVHGIKFRHQHAVGRFILDFYTVEFRLAIEIDGEIHADRTEYDLERARYLNTLGIRVIRFTNDDVLLHLEHVINQITSACTHSSNSPLTQ